MDPLAPLNGFGVAALVGSTGVVGGSPMAPLPGSLPGIRLGARLTQTMPEWLLRGVLCLSLGGAGLKVLA